MEVLDLAEVAKLVLDGLLVGLFVHVGDQDDPSLDGADRGRLGMSLHGGDLAWVGGGLLGRDRLVEFHLVGHCCFLLSG